MFHVSTESLNAGGQEVLSSLGEASAMLLRTGDPRSWGSVVHACQSFDAFGSDCNMRVGGMDYEPFDAAIALLKKFHTDIGHLLTSAEQQNLHVPDDVYNAIRDVVSRSDTRAEEIQGKRDMIPLLEKSIDEMF